MGNTINYILGIEYISEDTFKHLEIKIQNIQGMITRFMESLNKS